MFILIKMYKFIELHWKYGVGILIAVSAPLALQHFMTHGIWKITLGGSNNGWLGFWGGYLGAIISVLGVYYQVSKELKANKSQFEISKYPKIRIVLGTIQLNNINPKIIQQYPSESDHDRINRYRSFTRIWREDSQRIAGISFANVSQNRFYDAIVLVEYSPKEILENDFRFHGRMRIRRSDRFAIPEMGESSKEVTILFVPYLFNAYFDNSVKKVKRLKKLKELRFTVRQKPVGL
ncbi:hypothetical protein [Secundilactobacillus yichangensis]|uniref:hypothetical protein n=1 Tax=Secundilactobacillus yichangensis TaxID=2799580 RepID=UPI001941B08B|nr:hypothetical protein [Secundilactobacillus yichangensis]